MFTIYLIEILTTLCWILFLGMVGTIIGFICFMIENYEDYKDTENVISLTKNEIERLKEGTTEKHEILLKKNEDALEEREKEVKKFNRIVARFIGTIILLTVLFVVTPSTRTAYRIWGIGSVVEYVRANPTAKGLPDKVINRLDKWLDKEDLTDKDNKEKSENEKRSNDELNALFNQ